MGNYEGEEELEYLLTGKKNAFVCEQSKHRGSQAVNALKEGRQSRRRIVVVE